MRSLMDCPSCACLIAAHEPACPFCGAAMRSAGAPMWLNLSFALSVGIATISCGSKGDGGGTESTSSDSTAGSESGSESGSGGLTDSGAQTTMFDPSNGEASAAAYAGPDEDWTTGTSTSGPETTTSSTTEPDTTEGSSSSSGGSTDTDPDASSSGTETGSGSSGDTGP